MWLVAAELLEDGGQVAIIGQVLQVARVHAEGSHPTEVLHTGQGVLTVGGVHRPETTLNLLEDTLGLKTK